MFQTSAARLRGDIWRPFFPRPPGCYRRCGVVARIPENFHNQPLAPLIAVNMAFRPYAGIAIFLPLGPPANRRLDM